MSDMIESLFQGMTILIDKKLEDLAFDTTIICRIVDDSNCKNGQYKVSDGSAIYTAYSEKQDYKSGESVRVAILNNDYSQRKFILGLYGDDEANTPITYVSSADSVVNISGNLVEPVYDSEDNLIPFSKGILMNGPADSYIIWNRRFPNGELNYLQNSGIYNTLIVKADFQTVMGNHKVTSGSYGLKIDLLIRINELADDCVIRKSATFSVSDMFGDPYNFLIPSAQSKVFPLSNVEGTIEGIEIYLFQNNSFKDQNGFISYEKQDPTTGELITEYPEYKHIFVKNLEVGFGSDITGIADNVIQLYTPDSLEYKYHLSNDSTNKKHIGLLWYNKNEYDKYLGFTDGYYDPTYDEVDYIKLSSTNTRLMAQMGQENIPKDKYGLRLAADIEDLDSLVNKVGKLITSELWTVLNNMDEEIGTLGQYLLAKDGTGILPTEQKKEEAADEVAVVDEEEPSLEDLGYRINENLTLLLDEKINNTVEEIKDAFSEAKAIYLDLLKSVSKKEVYKYKNGDGVETTTPFDLPVLNLETIGFAQQFKDFVNNEVIVEIDKIKQDISTWFDSYLGVFDIHHIRINRILNKITETLNTFPIVDIRKSYKEDFYEWSAADQEYNIEINKYKNITYHDYLFYQYYFSDPALRADKWEELSLFTDLEDYQAISFEPYGKKYCIYWYKYVKGYSPQDKSYSLLGDDWQLIQFDGKVNVGVPKYKESERIEGTDADGNTVYEYPLMNLMFCRDDEGIIEEYMPNDTKEQRYKVVLFYNHEMYISNELIFTNQDEVPNVTAIDKADGLEITHGAESSDSYLLYNETNYLQDSANEFKARQLTCHFNGLKVGDEEILPGASIYWYIPETSMLTYDLSYLKERGFVSDAEIDIENRPSYSKDGFICFYKQIQELIEEEEPEEEELPENPEGGNPEGGDEIEGENPEDEDETEEEVNIFLREEGEKKISCDTRDFWYKIRSYYEPNAGKNYIICKVIPKDSEDYYETKVYFSFGLMGTSGTCYTLAITNVGSRGAIQKPIQAVDDDGNLKVDEDGNKIYADNGNLALKVSLRDGNNKSLPIKISEVFDTDNSSNNWIFRSNDTFGPHLNIEDVDSDRFECRGADSPTSGILKFYLKNVKVEDERTVTMSQVYAVPWSRGDYYMSGTTRIVYNSLGTLQSNASFDIPYRLFHIKDDTEVTSPGSKKLQWRLKGYYYDKSAGTSSKFKDIDTLKTSNPPRWNSYKSALPTLGFKKRVLEVAQDVKVGDKTETVITMQEEDIENYNLLFPSSFYSQALGTELFPVIQAYDENGNIYWEQPLLIMQNNYESPMLNEWDGSFKIDESNSTIMSMMLGAGLKDENNQFSGVLMGNLAITELMDGKNVIDQNKSMVGLYGFRQGQQTFGFRQNGTAFIGGSGAGRIEFDGNEGYIQSNNYTESSGMRILLSNGAIDAYNFKLTSNRIILDSNSDPDIENKIYLTIYGDDDKNSTLMSVGDTEYYLQSKEFSTATKRALEWATDGTLADNGTAETVPFLDTPLMPGTKIDLGEGTFYAAPKTGSGLFIDSTGYSITDDNKGQIVLAVGSDFAVDCMGNLKARGNWELWADHDGKVGLRNDGVYARYSVGTATEVEESVSEGSLSKIFKYTKWGETKVGAGQASHWTDWDTIAGASQAFMKMEIWNTINSMASLVGVLGALGGATWLLTIELRMAILWGLYLSGGIFGGSGDSSS